MGYWPHQRSADFYGVHLTRLSNLVIDNEDPFPFGVANEDSADYWDNGEPTKIVIPEGQGGWYWIGADITTLGTGYGGSSNANVQLAVLKNWDGVSAQLGFYCAYERFENGNSTLAYGNSLGPQPVELAAGDVLQLVLIGGGGDLLVESNPSDGAPSGYLDDAGPGTLSPHFYVVRAGPGLPGPQGATGADGADGVVQSILAGANVFVDDSDPANPEVSASLDASWQLIDEAALIVTSGDITLNATSITNLTATQITLNGAVAGDIVFYDLSMLISGASSIKAFDAYTYPSGTRTNPFGVGISASVASTAGHPSWHHGTTTEQPRAGRARRVLVSGDIVSGDVVVGIAYAGTNSTAKTLYAGANVPIQVSAQLWRPPA